MFKSIHPIATVLFTATLLLSAGGGGSDDAAAGSSSSDSVDRSSDATFNEADVVFTRGMISHHAQAIEMASIALDPDSDASAEVRALAAEIQEHRIQRSN